MQYSKDSWKLPSTIQRRTSRLVYTCTVSYSCAPPHNCPSSLSYTLDIYYKNTKQTKKKISVHVFPTPLPSLGDYCPSLHLWLIKTSSIFAATGWWSDESLSFSKSCHWLLDEPLFLWFVNGFRVVGANDGCVRWLHGRLPTAFGLVGVVGAFVTEHVADQEHQST